VRGARRRLKVRVVAWNLAEVIEGEVRPRAAMDRRRWYLAQGAARAPLAAGGDNSQFGCESGGDEYTV
jgi:hypothetical protein